MPAPRRPRISADAVRDLLAGNVVAPAPTPPPWHVGGSLVASGARHVALVLHSKANGRHDTPDADRLAPDAAEADANARLIAAAPELLDALEAFLRAPSVGSAGPGSVTIAVQDFNLRAARAAVAKARP